MEPDRNTAPNLYLTALRLTKIIGIPTRLWPDDGKSGYLGHIPRIWRLLEKIC